MWPFLPPKEQYYKRYATGHPTFSILFLAIENSGPQVHQRHGTYLRTGGYNYSPNDRHMVPMYSQLYDDTTVTGILQPSNDLAEDGDITF